MKKTILIILFILLFIPNNISAKKCTDEQISRYKKLAQEIQTTFEYEEKKGEVNFTINFHNVYKDLYIVDYDTYDFLSIYKNNSDNIIGAPNYKQGTSYTFSVLNDKLCDSMIITKITVTTPNYNKYYSDPLCQGIENYSLCQKWTNIGNLSYDTFKQKISEYKESQKEEEHIINNQIEDNAWNKIRNFIAKYYIYILLGVIILVVPIVIIYRKKKSISW